MTWVLNNLELIGSRTLSHLLLAIPAIVASFVLALPLGWVANRYRWSRATLLTAGSHERRRALAGRSPCGRRAGARG